MLCGINVQSRHEGEGLSSLVCTCIKAIKNYEVIVNVQKGGTKV